MSISHADYPPAPHVLRLSDPPPPCRRPLHPSIHPCILSLLAAYNPQLSRHTFICPTPPPWLHTVHPTASLPIHWVHPETSFQRPDSRNAHGLIPMAQFPGAGGEGAMMDFLDPVEIRAIDVADECVRWRRRRCVEEPGVEMFISSAARTPTSSHALPAGTGLSGGAGGRGPGAAGRLPERPDEEVWCSSPACAKALDMQSKSCDSGRRTLLLSNNVVGLSSAHVCGAPSLHIEGLSALHPSISSSHPSTQSSKIYPLIHSSSSSRRH